MHADYLIVGAGQAGRRAAESLRSLAPAARICLVGEETELPYDRPILSKEALFNAEDEAKAFIQERGFYESQRIELRLGSRVAKVDRAARQVELANGERITYEKLLLATGSRARPYPGQVGEGVELLYLRTLEQARRLRDRLAAGKRLVILGGGFIGLEVAATARKLGCEVAVLEPAPSLLQRVMPKVIGDYLLALHRQAGVDVCLDTLPGNITRSANGLLIESSRGTYEADEVLVGIGALPNVELATEIGLLVENGIVVDERCRTCDPHIFAAGDVTCHFNPLLGRHVRVESWQVAEHQPQVAAANMLGNEESYAQLPWLWSDQYQCNLQTLGFFSGTGPVLLRGQVEEGAFSVVELDAEGRLLAVATVNQGRDMAAFKRLAASGKSLDAVALADSASNLRSLL
ncbi:NAD(P)/FAD-dependent oxidoreductase [Pseudomonas citronellolis]|uniref:NAD(P)/FAD-dependent oxidoreductase n=1 Tax=Pseudomonas citronellolis TaxID=53408 RepID=UPI000852BCFC|nr:FAD-dependent oxidoreductase [Pseudomonas humi]